MEENLLRKIAFPILSFWTLFVAMVTELLTGRYTDDFEADEDSDQFRSSEDEYSGDEDISPKQNRKPLVNT